MGWFCDSVRDGPGNVLGLGHVLGHVLLRVMVCAGVLGIRFVVCAGVAEQHGYKFTFMDFFKIGFPMTIIRYFIVV